MPRASNRKWRKVDSNNWVYEPSLTDAFPYRVAVVERTYDTNGDRSTADYQARFGRERLRFFNLGPWRPRPGVAREDARRFLYCHGSYDRLFNLYIDLVNHYEGNGDSFFVPIRRIDERASFAEAQHLLDLRPYSRKIA